MATLKGITLAIINVFVIAIGIGIAENEPSGAVVIVMLGGAPAMLTGGLLGLFAGMFATSSPRWRAALLALPACGLVIVLGSIFGLTAAIPVACIPTLVAALVLERWTREVTPSPVPLATVRSLRS